MKRILLYSLLSLCYSLQHARIDRQQPEFPEMKNIILMIGDGMGVAQVYAGMTVAGHPLNLEQFPFTGFSKTYSLSEYITDSAAGGTALSTGHKTPMGSLQKIRWGIR